MPCQTCCICAGYISADRIIIDENSEKPRPSSQEYPCCSRLICHQCVDKRPQFSNYCLYCQHTGSTTDKAASPSPSRDPAATLGSTNPPQCSHSPLYNPRRQTEEEEFSEKQPEPAPDVLHFVDPAHDTVTILSIRYGVPAPVLRRQNAIYSDHLLAGRKTVLISGEYYTGGVSLSPRPVEGEEEELRKAKIRKWMMACKVVDYEIALFYLKQVDYDLEFAIMAYKDDEQWEQENPFKAKAKEKGRDTGLWTTGSAMPSSIRR